MISAIFTTIFQILDTVLTPILQLGPYISMAIFAIALALLFSLIYWKFLDKEQADKIKDKLQDHQDKMKEARKNDEDEKAQKHLKKTLELNQKFMATNLKPMMVTMIFIAVLFPWLGATYSPTIPMDQIDNQTYQGNLTFANQQTPITVENQTEELKITINEQNYQIDDRAPLYGIDWHLINFNPEHEPGFTSTLDEGPAMRASAEFIPLPFSIPIAGNALNWLGFYIILAMPLTFAFRKMLGVT